VLVALGFSVVVLIARPLARLVEHARGVGKGDFRSITVRGVVEVAELGRAASQMAERLAAERSRERSLSEKRLALSESFSEQRANLEASALEDARSARGCARRLGARPSGWRRARARHLDDAAHGDAAKIALSDAASVLDQPG